MYVQQRPLQHVALLIFSFKQQETNNLESEIFSLFEEQRGRLKERTQVGRHLYEMSICSNKNKQNSNTQQQQVI